ncbi:hypothetical protein J6590_039194, partial [Homalodisca vitripennis]
MYRATTAVLASSKLSVRRQIVALGMSRRSLHHILHDDLKFYWIKIIQQLCEADIVQR